MKIRFLTIILAIFIATTAACSNANASAKTHRKPRKTNTENAPAEQTPKCPNGMAAIPPGKFIMGCDLGSSRKCQTKLKLKPEIIAESYCMDKYETTYKQFKKVMKTTLEYENDCGPDCPILFITYEKASEYCQKTGKRLPTEKEWEYAARAGSQTKYYWGAKMNGGYLWSQANSGGRFHPVGQKKPNKYGLFDMLGNAYEYVYQDCGGAPCDKITIRGGDYSTPNPTLSTKTSIDRADFNSYTSFRCAQDAPVVIKYPMPAQK